MKSNKKSGQIIEPLKAWAVLYEGKYFNVFINDLAKIYATRSSAYEYANGSKVIQVLITPLPKRKKK